MAYVRPAAERIGKVRGWNAGTSHCRLSSTDPVSNYYYYYYYYYYYFYYYYYYYY
jgi:hypothetical protein